MQNTIREVEDTMHQRMSFVAKSCVFLWLRAGRVVYCLLVASADAVSEQLMENLQS